MSNPAIPLWIIAVCAAIWTTRMLLVALAVRAAALSRWADHKWEYGKTPKAVVRYKRIVEPLRERY